MRSKRAKRILSLVLSIAMLMSQIGVPVLAQAAEVEIVQCGHHTAHTADCGYAEGTDCAHVHDAACNKIDSGIGAPSAPGVSNITITAFDKLEQAVQERSVDTGTALAELNLPTQLSATGYPVTEVDVADSGSPSEATPTPAAIIIDGVTWEIDPEHEINDGNSTYDPEIGSYCFTPILPSGYTLAKGVALPEIWVMVGVGGVLFAALTEHDISTGSLTLSATSDCLTSGTCTGHSVTGETGEYRIVVEGGAHNITLAGVSIDMGDAKNACAFELGSAAEVNLTLAEGSDNTLKSGEHVAGLQVPVGTKLTIGVNANKADIGRLTAASHYYGAGIGGGSAAPGGTITINGGYVTAIGGGRDGAGMGAGTNGAGGTITINGGEVTAVNGINGTTTIKDGTVKSDRINGTTTIDAGEVEAEAISGTVTINGGAVKLTEISATVVIPEGKTATISGTVANTSIVTVYGTLNFPENDGSSWKNVEGGQLYWAYGGTITGLADKQYTKILEGSVSCGELWVASDVSDAYTYSVVERTLTVTKNANITIGGTSNHDSIVVAENYIERIENSIGQVRI